MAAFVVVLPPQENRAYIGTPVNIFPGSATPAVVAANTPFWIGYGFVADAGDRDRGVGARFELDVDGASFPVGSDVSEGLRPAATRFVAELPSGLGAGWHRFVGRWYDGGALVLTSDRWIEFVER